MHILQSPQWARFRLKTPNVKKVLHIGRGQIFIHHISHLPFTVAYLPRPEKLDKIEEIKGACRRERALFLKIEPTLDYRLRTIDSRLPTTDYRVGQPVLPRHTIHVDLTKSEEQLLAEMHEKTRYNIHLAEKKGVKVREGENLEEFIKLLEKTEERQNFYSHPVQYYRTLWETLRPDKMVYLLTANCYPLNAPIASIMLFCYKDILYYPYGGSDPQYREMMAPHLLHWEAIKLGKKLGCKIYDMWGSYKEKPEESDPWWGIYRFKRGFGGEEITFPKTIDVPLSPLYSLYPLVEKFRGLTRK